MRWLVILLVVLLVVLPCPGCYTHRTLVAIDEARGWRTVPGVPRVEVEVELSGATDRLQVHVRYADGSRREAWWNLFDQRGPLEPERTGRAYDAIARITSTSGPLVLGTIDRHGEPYRRTLYWDEHSLELVEDPLRQGWRRTTTFWFGYGRRWVRRAQEERRGDVVLLCAVLPFAVSLDLVLWSGAIATLLVWSPLINDPTFAAAIGHVFPDMSPELASED